jgi:hypothetical protein
MGETSENTKANLKELLVKSGTTEITKQVMVAIQSIELNRTESMLVGKCIGNKGKVLPYSRMPTNKNVE